MGNIPAKLTGKYQSYNIGIPNEMNGTFIAQHQSPNNMFNNNNNNQYAHDLNSCFPGGTNRYLNSAGYNEKAIEVEFDTSTHESSEGEGSADINDYYVPVRKTKVPPNTEAELNKKSNLYFIHFLIKNN
jgi:hypothetical protein